MIIPRKREFVNENCHLFNYMNGRPSDSVALWKITEQVAGKNDRVMPHKRLQHHPVRLFLPLGKTADEFGDLVSDGDDLVLKFLCRHA